jgi:hypothetical protein
MVTRNFKRNFCISLRNNKMDAPSAFTFANAPPDISKLILYQLDPQVAQICMQAI